MPSAPHPGVRAPGPSVPRDDASLVAALRAGDEAAFREVVRRHHATLRRVARGYVSSDAVADEVVQETWLAVIKGLDRFEGRSSFKTWLFHILANVARSRGVRERRIVPLASLEREGDDQPAVDPARFQGAGDAWPGHWSCPPRPWQDPDRRLGSLECRELLKQAIADLPPIQQAVLTLRDVEGLEAEEVCELLELTAVNQRVILHRARARLRTALEGYVDA